MPTQMQIAEHLDLNQSEVSRHLEKLGIDWNVATMDQIRVAYLRHLRAVASGHRSEDGLDLTRERVLTERVDRELKLLTMAEKKRMLINVSQLEPELLHLFGAFRSELLARDDKLKSELDALYGTDIDLNILNEHTTAALSQLSRYDTRECGFAAAVDADAGATREAVNNGMVTPPPGAVGESISASGPV